MGRKTSILLIVAVALFAAFLFCYIWFVKLPARHIRTTAETGITDRPVIAHRGASWWAPEETLPAYLLARDLGVDYLEMDMQRTKDHVLIVFHDDNPARTTNVAQVFPGRENKGLEEFTWDELKQLDAGSWFNAANPARARASFKGLHIMTLDEVITVAEGGQNKPSLYIETKSPQRHPGYEQELVDLLKRRGWLGKFPGTDRSKVLFQSFERESLQRLKDLAPEVPRLYLIGSEDAAEITWPKFIEDAATLAQGIGPVAFIALPWNIARAHRAGLIVHPYTANAPSIFRLLDLFGADSYFTDRCDLALTYNNRKLPAPPPEILTKLSY